MLPRGHFDGLFTKFLTVGHFYGDAVMLLFLKTPFLLMCRNFAATGFSGIVTISFAIEGLLLFGVSSRSVVRRTWKLLTRHTIINVSSGEIQVMCLARSVVEKGAKV